MRPYSYPPFLAHRLSVNDEYVEHVARAKLRKLRAMAALRRAMFVLAVLSGTAAIMLATLVLTGVLR